MRRRKSPAEGNDEKRQGQEKIRHEGTYETGNFLERRQVSCYYWYLLGNRHYTQSFKYIFGPLFKLKAKDIHNKLQPTILWCILNCTVFWCFVETTKQTRLFPDSTSQSKHQRTPSSRGFSKIFTVTALLPFFEKCCQSVLNCRTNSLVFVAQLMQCLPLLSHSKV